MIQCTIMAQEMIGKIFGNDLMIKVIHVNNILKELVFGSGQDQHELLNNGKMNDFDQLKNIDKIKILETPNRNKWMEELDLIQTKIVEFEVQNI